MVGVLRRRFALTLRKPEFKTRVKTICTNFVLAMTRPYCFDSEFKYNKIRLSGREGTMSSLHLHGYDFPFTYYGFEITFMFWCVLFLKEIERCMSLT